MEIGTTRTAIETLITIIG